MSVKLVSEDSSERENWDKIFKSLVKILEKKQDQLKSLLKERKIHESKIKITHENWLFTVQNYEDQLSLMRKEIETNKMIEVLMTSKFNLLGGLKEKDRSVCNVKLELTMDELSDFKAWFDYLTLNTNARNQLKRKDDELAQAKTKISSLESNQEQLQSSNHEKDEIISKLKAKVTEMETDFIKKDEEISKLKQDLESLKKFSGVRTPVLTRRRTRQKKHRNGDSSTSSTSNEKVSKSSKRKRVKKTPLSVSEIPKLFSSSFKVPKLKSPSSGAI